MEKAMRLGSVWNVVAGVCVGGAMTWEFSRGETPRQELVLVFALALFHIIFAIWFAKGRALQAFARASVWGRAVGGTVCAATAVLLWRSGEWMQVSRLFAGFLPSYLGVHGLFELIGAVFTQRSLPIPGEAGSRPSRPTNLHEKNRFVFAIYVGGIGLWLLFSSSSFLTFFRLPDTIFSLMPRTIGPIHVLGAQILVLAYYNFVAVRGRLEPLIAAGMRGGLFTCVFFIAMVAAGVLHPLTLLLPAVDLISIVVLLAAQIRSTGAAH